MQAAASRLAELGTGVGVGGMLGIAVGRSGIGVWVGSTCGEGNTGWIVGAFGASTAEREFQTNATTTTPTIAQRAAYFQKCCVTIRCSTLTSAMTMLSGRVMNRQTPSQNVDAAAVRRQLWARLRS